MRYPSLKPFHQMPLVWKITQQIVWGLGAFVLIAVLVPSGVWAQRITATLSGTVTDSTGAVIPSANLTATSETTHSTYTSVSDASGYYIFNNLAPDEYHLRVEKTGFKTYEQSGIILRVEQAATVNVALTVGLVSQSVSVTGTATQVNTVTSTITSDVTPAMAVELPLNGRNVLQLMTVAPDTGPSSSSGYIQTNSNPNANVFVSASGGRGDSVNFFMDGSMNEDTSGDLANGFPNPDAIKEFSFETNNYSAKYGGRGGGVMNVATKNGTNQFHGTAFEFVRYYPLNGGNFFTHSQDGLKRNQFGGSVGGPILKDKLFFFFSPQYTTLASLPSENTAIVPTLAQRGGDWSSISKQLVNPFTQVPYMGNQIPPSAWNIVATNYMALVPPAQQSNGVLYYTTSVPQTEKQYLGRFDWNFSNKFRFYATIFNDKWNLPKPITTGDILSYAEQINVLSQDGVLNFSYTVSPHLLATLSFGLFQRFSSLNSPQGAPDWQDLGATFPDILPAGDKTDYLSISGYFSQNYANANSINSAMGGDLANNWAWVKGNHTLEFGFELNKLKVYYDGNSIADGGFAFSNAYSGNNMVDFLLGAPSTFYQYGLWHGVAYRPLWGSYGNDTWKVTRKLTLDLGVRWNPFYMSTVPGQGNAYFSQSDYNQGIHSTAYPNLPPGYLVGGFDAGIPRTGINPVWDIFDPRLGFAYDLFGNGKTSIRGGYGLFQEQAPTTGATISPAEDPPFTYRVIDSPPPGPMNNPYGSTTPPFPIPFPTPPSLPIPEPLVAAAMFSAGLKPPTVQEWNFTVEHQLPHSTVLRVAYEGAESYHLQGSEEGNPAIYNPSLTVSQNLATTLQRRIEYPYYSSSSRAKSIGTSSYEGLTISALRQMGHTLTFIGGYRWSKCLDEGTEYVWYDSDTYTLPNDPSYDKGQCTYDIGSKLTFSYVYALPTIKSLGFVGKHILGGWQSSGILTWEDGLPFGISTGTNNATNGISFDRANFSGTASPLFPGGRPLGQKLAEWFNTQAFVPNAAGGYGDTAREFLRGPGLSNFDFGLIKEIPIPIGPAKETQHLEFRGEFFNLFNHPQFALPTSTLSSTTDGEILSTVGNPRIVQLALKFIF